jgi:FixJ family two-component response regulator
VKRVPLVTPGIRRDGQRMHYTISKVCVRCSTVKDLAEFYVMPSKNGALAPYCKQCNSEARIEWVRRTVRTRNVQTYDQLRQALLRGESVSLTQLPWDVRRAAMFSLIRADLPPKVIARRLRCSIRTVYRYAVKERKAQHEQHA